MNLYKEKGYQDRDDYLESLANEYGINSVNVFFLAEMLGESEDFDGLINALEDFCN